MGRTRAQEKRAARRQIDDSAEEIEKDQAVRETQEFFYALYPEWFANRQLERYGLRPPARGSRTAE